MKILTLDLSTKSSGYAIGQDGVLKNHGCVTVSSADVIKRIIKMRDQISELIKSNKLNKIVMQEVRPQYNSHTGKVLMWLQAVIVVAAYQIDQSIECVFTGASQWRKVLGMSQGRGIRREKLKQQDIKYVENKYSIMVNDDQADAICIFDSYWMG